jgi:hypothetical protein
MHALSVTASTLSAASWGQAHFTKFFWDSALFQKDKWEGAMNVLRIGLTFVGALLLLYEVRARKLGEHIPEKWRRRVAIGMAVLAFGAYFDFFNPNNRYNEYYHRHEFFHYYLGSKYNHELGYTDLYECTAVAEVELGRGAQVRRRELRDLRVNLVKPVTDTYVFSNPNKCKKRFTKKRWAAFKKDVNWFYHSSAGSYWDNMQKDHGYNPPPVWTMEGKFFGSFAPAGDKYFKILSSVDILFHIGVALLMFWAFGWRVGAIAVVFWGCNAPANFYWTGGAFLRQDWLFFLVASICMARKRKYVLSGGALTWSALLRIFPLILFVGPAIVMAIELVKKRRLRTEYKRFIGGCIVAGGLLVPASIIVAGPQSYPQFIRHIEVLKDTPLTNDMGLKTILVHTWRGRMRFTENDSLNDPFQLWKEGRNRRYHQDMPIFLAITGLVFLWTVWSLRRTKSLWIAMPLGLCIVTCLTDITCYYYSMFILAAVLARARPNLGPVILAVSGASQVLYLSFYFVDDKFTAIAYLFFAFGLLLLYGYSRPFSMARLKAWWHDEPEPKSKRLTGGESAATA